MKNNPLDVFEGIIIALFFSGIIILLAVGILWCFRWLFYG